MKQTKSFFNLLFRSNEMKYQRILATKQDFENVLNFYLLDYWEMEIFDVPGYAYQKIVISSKLPFFKNRYKKMQKFIEERRNYFIFVEFK